jgi:hypothetical protein
VWKFRFGFRGEVLEEHRGRTRLKANGSKTKHPHAKRGTGTDWDELRRRPGASIRKGIAADPDARATDAEFWKCAKAVMPTRKKS